MPTARPAVRAFLLLAAGCGAQPAADAPPPPPIDPALLRYRNDSANGIDAGGMLPTDSLQAYAAIDSYPLLRAIVCHRDADADVLPLAIERALQVAGPTRVLTDVRVDARRQPDLFASGPRRQLLDRAGVVNVTVSAVFFAAADFPAADAHRHARAMADRIRRGESFDRVTDDAWQADGTDVAGRLRCRMGNLGTVVACRAKHDGRPFVPFDPGLPDADVGKLLDLPTGGTLVTDGAVDDASAVRLYCVRERYVPPRP